MFSFLDTSNPLISHLGAYLVFIFFDRGLLEGAYSRGDIKKLSEAWPDIGDKTDRKTKSPGISCTL